MLALMNNVNFLLAKSQKNKKQIKMFHLTVMKNKTPIIPKFFPTCYFLMCRIWQHLFLRFLLHTKKHLVAKLHENYCLGSKNKTSQEPHKPDYLRSLQLTREQAY